VTRYVDLDDGEGRVDVSAVRPVWRIPGILLRERRSVPGRPRIPEPMVMDDPASVAHFHAGGAENPGMQAVYDLGARAVASLLPPGGRLLDLGVGSGRALSAILRRRSDITVTAVDLAPNMLATARAQFDTEGTGDRVRLVEADLTALPGDVLDTPLDAVSCMWTLHQLPDIAVLRAALRQIAALRARHGCAAWISDFQRLRNPSTCDEMLRCFDPQSPEVLRNDAIASEAAAFTIEELTDELRTAGLDGFRCGHATPLPYLQTYWWRAPGHPEPGPSGQRDRGLSLSARREAAVLRWGFTATPF
jgi:SAM-dependent methyltransferase